MIQLHGGAPPPDLAEWVAVLKELESFLEVCVCVRVCVCVCMYVVRHIPEPGPPGGLLIA